MDIGLLETKDAHNTGSECRLIQADGKVSEAFVVVQGLDSDAYRIAKRKQRNKIVSLREKNVDFDEYDFFSMDVNFAAEIINGWANITQDGKPIKFTKAAVKKFLLNSPVNVDRVLEFCGERVNFTKG